MPNNITNILTVQGVPPSRVQEILSAIQNDERGVGSIDFEKIIPPPPDMFRGNIGPAEREKYGKNTWLAFNTKNYGAKWNAYGYSDLPPYEPGSDTIRFHTAWSHPEPVLLRLSELFPNAEFSCRWADEDLGVNVGEQTYQNGVF